MKKIGLLNIQNVDNYGANLIALAMEKEVGKLVENANCVQTINFSPDLKKSAKQANSVINCWYLGGMTESLKKIRIDFLRFFTRIAHKIGVPQKMRAAIHRVIYRNEISRSSGDYIKYDPTNKEKDKREENFARFRKEYLHCSKVYSDATFSKEKYNVIIVGSDVVWKPQRLLSRIEKNGYFLTTASGSKKIAYAASIGITDRKVLNRLRSKYKKRIKEFDYISMREKASQKYIEELLADKTIYHCIDPTFFLTYEDCKELAKAADIGKIQNRNYIYVYILGDNEDAICYANKLAKEKNLDICFHSGIQFRSNAKSVYSDGPKEFIYHIFNADYVITDSFHGTVFSIIMKKQFFSFTRGKFSIRLEELVNKLGMEDRLVDHIAENMNIDNVIPYSNVEKLIREWCGESELFLRMALEDLLEV